MFVFDIFRGIYERKYWRIEVHDFLDRLRTSTMKKL